jgi:4-aminobutyrate aminotransferase/(S)-3-amino-2-methylpropionate transaminase
LACAAALEALSVIDRSRLPQRAEQMARDFDQLTYDWQERFPLIGDIRGVGAMRAIELVRDRPTKEPAPEETNDVLAACHRQGLVILSAGIYHNVIRLLAPIVATDDQFAEGMAILERALSEVQAKVASR